MAKGKSLTQADLEKTLAKAFGVFGAKIGKRFDAVDKRLDQQDLKIMNLQVDAKDIKRDQREMKQQQDVIKASLLSLHRRVRYQNDFPERLEQAEHDIHDLKRDVHHLKTR